MNIRNVSVQLSRKISDTQFGSQQVGVSITADLEPGDDFNACFEDLYALARHKLSRKIESIVDMGESHKRDVG